MKNVNYNKGKRPDASATKGNTMWPSKEKNNNIDTELFVVYDSKTDSYSDLIPAVNSLDVTREFFNAFMDPTAIQKNKYYKNAEDFSLFKIGSYGKKTAQLITNEPTHVVNFHELRSQTDREKLKNANGALSST